MNKPLVLTNPFDVPEAKPSQPTVRPTRPVFTLPPDEILTNESFHRQLYQPAVNQGLNMADITGARRVVYPTDGVTPAKLGFSPFSRGAVRAVVTDLPNTSIRDGMVWRQLKTPQASPKPGFVGPPTPEVAGPPTPEVAGPPRPSAVRGSIAHQNAGGIISKINRVPGAVGRALGLLSGGVAVYDALRDGSVSAGDVVDIAGATAFPGIYTAGAVRNELEQQGRPLPALGSDLMDMNGDDASARLNAQSPSIIPNSTFATDLASSVAQLPSQMPTVSNSNASSGGTGGKSYWSPTPEQAMSAMAGNYAPINTQSVSQGLGIDMPQTTPHVGNTQMLNMANVNAILAQKQREEATRRAVQQSLPQQAMGYTMQPTVSVQPYGNGGTQFNLNQNTTMFDNPEYQRLYALRAQQAQQALANTNQPVTYDQALAHARAGTSWR